MNEKRQIPDSILCPHCGKPVIKYRNPLPTVDVIISHDGGVVLVLRKNPPAGWAIPGGFIDYGESAEDAAIREMKEETGLDIHNLELFTVRSDPGRDPRHHTLTVVFTAEAREPWKLVTMRWMPGCIHWKHFLLRLLLITGMSYNSIFKERGDTNEF